MIKLIATDLDGTLLDSSKNFNQEFFEIYKELKKYHIYFVIASGNQFYKLYERFLPISGELIYIADNGCMIVRGRNVLSCDFLKEQDQKYIVELIKQYPLVCVLSGKECAYIDRQYKQYDHIISRHYSVYEYVDHLENIKEQALKISVYCPLHNNHEYINQIAMQLPSHLRIVTAGNEWMDISSKDIHKGKAIKYLQELYDINEDECVAFGDQMNDYEMLCSVKYAYAMGNAVDDIKNISYEVIKTNDEDGVICKLKEILEFMEV